jgi:hypothetical protein
VGKHELDAEQEAHPGRVIRHPRLMLNLGARIGAATYAHLSPDPANPGQLAAGETDAHAWATGASGAYVVPRRGIGVTVEALASWGFAYEPSTSKARWCSPAGNVTVPGGAAPAEVCRELRIAASARDHEARGAVYAGVLDPFDPAWRFAADVEVVRTPTDRWRKTVAVPITLFFAGEKLPYKGLVRVAPAISFGGGEDVAYAISVALLGQRTTFSEEFDRL